MDEVGVNDNNTTPIAIDVRYVNCVLPNGKVYTSDGDLTKAHIVGILTGNSEEFFEDHTLVSLNLTISRQPSSLGSSDEAPCQERYNITVISNDYPESFLTKVRMMKPAFPILIIFSDAKDPNEVVMNKITLLKGLEYFHVYSMVFVLPIGNSAEDILIGPLNFKEEELKIGQTHTIKLYFASPQNVNVKDLKNYPFLSQLKNPEEKKEALRNLLLQFSELTKKEASNVEAYSFSISPDVLASRNNNKENEENEESIIAELQDPGFNKALKSLARARVDAAGKGQKDLANALAGTKLGKIREANEALRNTSLLGSEKRCAKKDTGANKPDSHQRSWFQELHKKRQEKKRGSNRSSILWRGK